MNAETLIRRAGKSDASLSHRLGLCLLFVLLPALVFAEQSQGDATVSLAPPAQSWRTYLVEDSESGNSSRERGRPPIERPRIVREIMVGAITGAAVAIPGFLIGFAEGASSCPPSGGGYGAWEFDFDVDCELERGAVGAGVGYALGCAIGVYIVGDTENETGNLLATLLGAAGGALLGSNRNPGFLLVGAPVGAVIGFNMTRRYKSPAAFLEDDSWQGSRRFSHYSMGTEFDSQESRLFTHTFEILRVVF